MSTLEELDDLDRREKEEKRRGNNGKKATVTDGDDEMKDAEEKDDILDDEILSLSTQDIQTRKRLLENDSRIMKSELSRLTHEKAAMGEKIKENMDKIANNRQLPYLVGNVVELLDLDPTAESSEEGANIDLDATRVGKSAVIKTSTRQTIFLPLIGLVDSDKLKPGDLIGVNKDSYLVLDTLPAEYDSRVKAMEVDEKPTEQYTDVGGLDKQIEELVEAIVWPMKEAERFKKIGIKAPKGALMYGPPGTGKTLMARACAAQTEATFLKLAGPQLVQMFIGDGAKLVRDCFALAKEKAPAIIFIDELDAVGTKRFDSEKSGDREVQRTMLELLNQLDGFASDDRIKVLAATNRVDVLDPALLRSGRLDRKIEFPLPNEEARAQILKIHSRKMKVDPGVNWGELARSTDEFGGAMLKAVCVEAGMIALRSGKNQIGHEHYVDAIAEVQAKKKDYVLIVGLAVSGAAASNWFPGSKTVYNKWHETELERWLSDQNIPYPSAADRKDLEDLVSKNWNSYVVEPYNSWDVSQLSAYLQSKGSDVAKDAQKNKDSLVSQVKANWYETEDSANSAWTSVKDWILDTWTDSQLKSFCDKNGIPVPQPRTRDTLLQKAREGYATLAEKAGETAAYPGDWLYSTWTTSDLKEWLDTHGFPAPQPTDRDKLIASVRRNSRLAYLRAQNEADSAAAKIQAAYTYLTDTIIDAWGESQLKEFCDKNGIPVPQGTKLNELRALVRKHRADILGDTVGASAKAYFGAATSNAQNQYARATDSASLAAQDAFNQAVNKWSDSRLKSYLDARGIPVPQASKSDELRALVRKHAHKASTGWQAWNFDDYSYDNLKNYLIKNGNAAAKAAAKKKDATREDLVSAAQSAYSSASTAGGAQYASATSYLASVTAAAKHNAFDTWSESELKNYLDSYGVPVPQGSKIDELRAEARKQATYFRYGSSSPSGTVFAKIGETARDTWRWVADQLHIGSEVAREEAAKAEAEAKKKGEKLRKEL
ncbi:hypothetical protein M431DRAFT_498879 [Trichoderma harzianum CBS 226.95]|uniref:26S proteasome regulatory subunit 6A n=1 Tax=Trichoderma harzianum CBS 226.95 TaxID=983964 RepID=A0A2T4A118_TRIHA|nr:hypothetical protein M431DRAFT_498879 [Trichoderma harzianum CBS 226.95]PTB50756.1 hypothetical protein M431DRAFT_498879 [Trichoderma harzianum CBS 226.95]